MKYLIFRCDVYGVPMPRRGLRGVCEERCCPGPGTDGSNSPMVRHSSGGDLIFVFVSYHPNLFYMAVISINFPPVESVLPVTVTDK